MPEERSSTRSGGDWIGLAALAVFAVIFYRGVLFTGRVYVFRDLVTFFYSMEHLARLLSQWGWPPEWNSFAVLGRPFSADPLTGVFYPPNWVLRQLPVALGFDVSLALHHAWAAWGAMLLARQLRVSLIASLLTGVLYGFAGPMVSCDNLYNGLVAASWAPWVVLAFVRWCEGPSFARLALTAIALAMSVLGAMPEFTVFTGVILVGVALHRGRAGEGARVGARIAALALAGVMAAGLCAVQLLPSAEFVAHTSRASGLNVANALQNSLDPVRVSSFLWPQPLAAGAKPWLLSLYVGPALLLSLAVPIFLPRRERAWAALAVVFLCLAFGEHLPGYAWVIEHVASLRVVRYPEKFVLGLHGLLALGAGIGLDALMRRTSRLGALAAAAVVLLTAVDLYRVNAELLPAAPWSEIAAPPASTRIMDRGDDPLRIYSNGIGLPDLPPYPEGLHLERDLMLWQSANLYGIANLNAPATLNLADHEALEQLLESAPKERAAGLLGAFNTAYVTSVRALIRPGLTMVREPSTPRQVFVYRVEPLAARVTVPSRVRSVATAEEALAHLREAEAPAADVVVEESSVAVSLEGIEGTATLVRYLPSRVDIRASMQRPGYVVLADSFDAGWRARVDGAVAPILRANHFARAVPVAVGEHEIAFEYQPRSARLGMLVTLATALSMAAGIALRRRDRSSAR